MAAYAMAYMQSLNKEKLTSDSMGLVEIIKVNKDGSYIVDYNGVKCTAILNCFNGCLYADDVYGIVKENV